MDTNKHLLKLLDWDIEQIQEVLNLSAEIKAELKNQGPSQRLAGRSIAMYFEKPSLRTITTFQIGMTQLGGSSVQLDPVSIGLGKREPIKDVARCIGRWADAMVIRCFEQSLIEDFAQHSGIPVINALTDDYHPCQALALIQSMVEHMGGQMRDLRGKTITFVGDGNNVANSIAIIAAKIGINFNLACPDGYEQPQELLDVLEPIFKSTNSKYQRYSGAKDAVKSADIIYTDVWASMGQESEQAERAAIFMPFQVNEELMQQAPETCLVTHCLPAHRGEEISAGIMESDRNICFDEAENRLHAQKAVMAYLIK